MSTLTPARFCPPDRHRPSPVRRPGTERRPERRDRTPRTHRGDRAHIEHHRVGLRSAGAAHRSRSGIRRSVRFVARGRIGPAGRAPARASKRDRRSTRVGVCSRVDPSAPDHWVFGAHGRPGRGERRTMPDPSMAPRCPVRDDPPGFRGQGAGRARRRSPLARRGHGLSPMRLRDAGAHAASNLGVPIGAAAATSTWDIEILSGVRRHCTDAARLGDAGRASPLSRMAQRSAFVPSASISARCTEHGRPDLN